jgi:hypothetical protein
MLILGANFAQPFGFGMVRVVEKGGVLNRQHHRVSTHPRLRASSVR